MPFRPIVEAAPRHDNPDARVLGSTPLESQIDSLKEALRVLGQRFIDSQNCAVSAGKAAGSACDAQESPSNGPIAWPTQTPTPKECGQKLTDSKTHAVSAGKGVGSARRAQESPLESPNVGPVAVSTHSPMLPPRPCRDQQQPRQLPQLQHRHMHPVTKFQVPSPNPWMSRCQIRAWLVSSAAQIPLPPARPLDLHPNHRCKRQSHWDLSLSYPMWKITPALRLVECHVWHRRDQQNMSSICQCSTRTTVLRAPAAILANRLCRAQT